MQSIKMFQLLIRKSLIKTVPKNRVLKVKVIYTNVKVNLFFIDIQQSMHFKI